jgi:hypothetical protein
MLQVQPGANQTDFLWDYALAWRIGKAHDKDNDLMKND